MIKSMYLVSKNGKYKRLEFSANKINYIYGDSATGKSTIIKLVNYIFGDRDDLDVILIKKVFARVVIVFELKNVKRIVAKEVNNQKTFAQCIEFSNEALDKMLDLNTKLKDSEMFDSILNEYFKVRKAEKEYCMHLSAKNISNMSYQYYEMLSSTYDYINTNKIVYYELQKFWGLVLQTYDMEYLHLEKEIATLEKELRMYSNEIDTYSSVKGKIDLLMSMYGVKNMAHIEFVNDLKRDKFSDVRPTEYNEEFINLINKITEIRRKIQELKEIISDYDSYASQITSVDEELLKHILNHIDEMRGTYSKHTNSLIDKFLASITINDKISIHKKGIGERKSELERQKSTLEKSLADLNDTKKEYLIFSEGASIQIPFSEYRLIFKDVYNMPDNILEMFSGQYSNDITSKLSEFKSKRDKLSKSRKIKAESEISSIIHKYYRYNNVLKLEKGSIEFTLDKYGISTFIEQHRSKNIGSTFNHCMLHISTIFAIFEYLFSNEDVVRRALPILAVEQPCQANSFNDPKEEEIHYATKVKDVAKMFQAFYQANKNIQLFLVETVDYRNFVENFDDEFHVVMDNEKLVNEELMEGLDL